MNRKSQWPHGPVLLAALLLLATSWACTPRPGADDDAESKAGLGLGAEEVLVDLIAYTGADGGLFTIQPDGQGSRRLAGGGVEGAVGRISAQGLTPDALFTWPTWSPDGRRVAFSRILPADGSVAASIHAVDVASQEATLVYENQPGSSPFIAQDASHYLYWSPDGSLLTFIASTATGLTLFASPANGPGEATPLATRGPIYYSWAADGSGLLTHMGGSLGFLANPGLDQPLRLADAGVGFRVPALSPAVPTMAAYVAPDNGGEALFSLDLTADRSMPRSLTDVGPSAAFLWSPDGGEIAVADSPNPDQPLYQRLRVVQADGASERTLIDESLLAFFWSPDGQWLLYATVAPSERALMWKVVPAAGGAPRELLEFNPSSEQFTMISFFDQYAYSHSLWAPDSSRFVFTGALSHGAGQTNGVSPSTDRIYAVDVAAGTATEIASGRIAFWSWN